MTDALRTPARKLLAGPDGRAVADLVFLDRERAGTMYRTCVVRRGPQPLRTCFRTVTAAVGTPTVTPLRFQRGRYGVTWRVAGDVVARWTFRVV